MTGTIFCVSSSSVRHAYQKPKSERQWQASDPPLTPGRVTDVRTVLSGTFGSQCWDLYFRFTDEQKRAAGIDGKMTPEHEARRKEILAKLARRKRGSAGLVAYADGEPVGYILARTALGQSGCRAIAGDTRRRRRPGLGHPVHHGPQGTPRQGRGDRDDPRGPRVCRGEGRACCRGLRADGRKARP